MIHVVHVRRAPFTVYIGRAFPNGNNPEFPESKWHNPYRTGTRFEKLSRFEAYARAHLWNDLHELDNQTFGCWCHPKACHGDVLKRLRQEQIDAVRGETVSGAGTHC